VTSGVMSIGLHTPSRRQAALTLALLAATPPLAALAAAELSEEQQVIVEAWAMVQRGYVDQQFGGKDWKAIKSDYLKRKYTSMAQARGAVSSMLAELGDRYTRYLTPGAYEALLAKYERPADNGGIGVTVRNLPGVTPSPVEIVSVVEGAPAAAAGLRVGDIFETIDKRSLPADATADDIAGLLLGRLDEPVSLSVRRADGATASATLRRVVLKAGEAEARVSTRAGGKRVGVLTLRTFSAAAASGGGGANGYGGTYESMERVLGAEPLVSAEELLIDLRGNLGGHFPSGVAAAKLFLPADATVVATVDRTGKPSPMLTFEPGKYARTGRPTYILVDRGTASAAEVFAAALQENRAAKVVGEQTYGKGLVQSIQKLTDGSAVVLTVAKYRTPRGNDINGKGVTPNLSVSCETGADAVSCLDAALTTKG